MSVAIASPGSRRRSDLARVLTAGTLVGILDGAFAVVLWVVIRQVTTIPRVFQSVAAGLLGRDAARAGGLPTAALGLAIHFTIGLAWAAVYYFAYRRLPALRRWTRTLPGAIGVGLVYGTLVWLAMDFIVLPLSRANPVPISSPNFLIQLLGHPFVVGLPIALVVRERE